MALPSAENDPGPVISCAEGIFHHLFQFLGRLHAYILHQTAAEPVENF